MRTELHASYILKLRTSVFSARIADCSVFSPRIRALISVRSTCPRCDLGYLPITDHYDLAVISVRSTCSRCDLGYLPITDAYDLAVISEHLLKRATRRLRRRLGALHCLHPCLRGAPFYSYSLEVASEVASAPSVAGTVRATSPLVPSVISA